MFVCIVCAFIKLRLPVSLLILELLPHILKYEALFVTVVLLNLGYSHALDFLSTLYAAVVVL